MNRKIIIKILGVLEEVYPKNCTTEILMKKAGLKDFDGEFYQIIKYLRETHKIIFVPVPESRMGYSSGRDKLIAIDEITINSAGIDFLYELKRLETDKNRNYLISDTTIVLTQIAILGIILTIYDKIGSKLLNTPIKIPWLLSIIIWAVIITFVLLLFYKIVNILFSKETWKGILFPRD